MVLHSLNIFLVLNLLVSRFLSSLLYLLLIYWYSLGKILLEDCCCFHYTLSATSNKDLQNRNLFPASPLLPSMKITCPCLIKVLNASLGILVVRYFIVSSIEFLLLFAIFIATQNYKKKE